MLDHPSLVVRLPDGTFAVNDEFRARVVIIDPTLDRILWQFGRTDRPGAGRRIVEHPGRYRRGSGRRVPVPD